jgi:hypothetical protein
VTSLEKARKFAMEALRKRADQRAADLAPIIAEIRAAGVTSYNGIAAALNEREIPTPRRGNGKWSAVQVQRVLERAR